VYLSILSGHILGTVNNKTREAICAQVAKLLRQERLQQKLSMARVAERAGLSYQMISYVERKMRNPTLDTMLRITSALGLDLGELIKKADQTMQSELK
jgi:transcriptional regulator with XRE-family HTH domain